MTVLIGVGALGFGPPMVAGSSPAGSGQTTGGLGPRGIIDTSGRRSLAGVRVHAAHLAVSIPHAVTATGVLAAAAALEGGQGAPSRARSALQADPIRRARQLEEVALAPPTSMLAPVQNPDRSQSSEQPGVDAPVLPTAAAAGSATSSGQPVASDAAAITLSASAGSDQTTTTSPPAEDDTPRGRGERLLARLPFDWQASLPGWTISFRSGRSGYRGSTFPGRQLIEVYVRDSQGDLELLHVIAHELGHAVDVTHLDDAERAAWSSARGFDGRSWWTGDGLNDFQVGAGDWAECFAWWMLRDGPFYSELARVPTSNQLGLMDQLAS